MLPILLILFTLLISIIASLILYARWNYGKLNGLGIPIIKPSFMLGSAPKIHTEVAQFEDIKRYKKYGPIWGMYQGRTPIIFIADPDLIRQIFVKDSSYFYDREPFDFGDSILNEILDFLPGAKWKTMRVSQTKLFSSGKIKQYSNEIFKQCMVEFMQKLDADLESSPNGIIKIDARNRFCTYTMDSIGRSMLSMKVEASDDNDFYNACKKLIGDGQTITSFYVWTLVFPFLTRFEPTLVMDYAMIETFRNILSYRKSNNQKFDDYGDIMNECLSKTSTPEYKKLGITETTVMGQAVNLFLAGFDRISTIMTFLVYHLAKNQEIQEKLHEEIDSIVDGKYEGKIDYETLADMPYLNACISESSRLYSTFIRPERVCNKDWECKEKNIKIPKGVIIQIASWAANRNPEVYENPDEFMPERFMPENKATLNPYSFSTFGFGHRNCIGMRFAYEAMRVSICHMLKSYTFQLRPDTQVKFKPGVIMIIQYDPIYLDVVRRK